jgi:hypothetical protein
MKDDDYKNIVWLDWRGAGYLPHGEFSQEFSQGLKLGEIKGFREVKDRDVSFHRAYFSLLNYIWSWLPIKFQKAVPESKFYKFIKHLKGEYNVIFEFKDMPPIIEYHSISFGRMNQEKFKDYVRGQLPYIYENVISKFFEGNSYDHIISEIENEYLKFLSKL